MVYTPKIKQIKMEIDPYSKHARLNTVNNQLQVLRNHMMTLAQDHNKDYIHSTVIKSEWFPLIMMLSNTYRKLHNYRDECK